MIRSKWKKKKRIAKGASSSHWSKLLLHCSSKWMSPVFIYLYFIAYKIATVSSNFKSCNYTTHLMLDTNNKLQIINIRIRKSHFIAKVSSHFPFYPFELHCNLFLYSFVIEDFYLNIVQILWMNLILFFFAKNNLLKRQ